MEFNNYTSTGAKKFLVLKVCKTLLNNLCYPRCKLLFAIVECLFRQALMPKSISAIFTAFK